MGLTTNYLEAALNLSVIPTDGGNSLRFGRVDLLSSIDKEVRIRVTSTESAQYQVYQRLIGSFTNERGEMVQGQVLSMSTLDGSNASGTLYGQNYDYVTYSDQLLYTSGRDGASDGFTIFYRVDPKALKASGNFIGKIVYTVRFVGAPMQDEVVLMVYLDTGGALKISSQTSSAGNRVRLSDETPQDQAGYIQLSYQGNITGSLNITQEVVTWPVNDLGRSLASEAFEFMVAEGGNGSVAFPEWHGVPPFRQKIYESASSEDSLMCQLRINQGWLEQQAAGTYRGSLRYTIVAGQEPREVDIDLEIKIQPVFKLDVAYPQGGVHFERILPNSPPQTKEVVVTVKTNLGRPYIISQKVLSPLTNEEGEQFDGNYFTMKQEFEDDESGKLQYPQYAPVPNGTEPMFYSDPKGTGVSFRVLYRQKPYSGMRPGSFKTSVVYSLEEI